MKASYTDDFSDPGGVAYLNCAFHGALPRVAAAAVEEALRLKQTPHRIRDEHHFDFPDAYRRAVAALVGGGPEEVAVADSATHGIMLLGTQGYRIGATGLLPWCRTPTSGVSSSAS